MKHRSFLPLVLLSLILCPVRAQDPGGHDHDHGHDATIRHRFDDVDRWVKTFDDPARDAWQEPEKVVRFLRISAGQSVADLGAGTGYFTVHLAKAVGAAGKAYAVDVEPNMVTHLGERAAKAKLPQVVPVLAAPDDPKLPAGGIDLVFICDTWHHIDDRLSYLERLAVALKPGGKIAVVDFREGEMPVGPPPGHKLSREAVVKEFEAARFSLVDEYTKLRYQYALVFAPPRGHAALAPEPAAHPVVVDTGFVAQAAARGAILWDVRGEEEFQKGHIPGATSIGDAPASLRDGGSEDYLPVPQMERILGEAGIDLSREIVVYGAKALPSPYFAYQTLRYLGARRVHVYHGGFDDWKRAGKPVSTERTMLPPATVSATVDPRRLVTTKDIRARLNEPDLQILDVRTPREYSGDDLRALRGGRIPGAVSIPYEQNWIDPDTPRKLQNHQVADRNGMALKSRDALQSLYAGLDPGKETVVYCQSGMRASETAAVLEDLGFRDVKIYDGSWLAWGNDFEQPVESVSYFNVGRVQSTLNQLQGRIDALEGEIEQLKNAAKKQ